MAPEETRGRALLRGVALAVLVIVGAAASARLGWEVRANEERAIADAVDTKSAEVVARLGHEFQGRLLALQRMSDRWRLSEGTPQSQWEHDASNYMSHFGGIRAIERVDPDGHVVWVAPSLYKDLVGVDLRAEPARRAAMDLAWRRQTAAVSPPLRLYTGGTGVLAFLPLYTSDRFDGWLGAVFEIEQLLGATLGAQDGYRLRIGVQHQVLYADPRPTSEVCSARALGVFYLGWRVDVCASPELVEARRGPLPEVAFTVGLAFTGLTGGLFAALLLAGDRERRARALAVSLREQADALDRAQRELAELSWSVSHELRAPLRAIDGYAALLAEGATPAVRAELARIRANAQRMGFQLDGLLELLRTARVPMAPSDVDVSALARAALARRQVVEPGRHVAIDVQDGLHVHGDASLIGTAVEALLDNAWKFTAGRDPAHIEVRACPGGFCVRDDGVGFDMAFARKLFGPFERLHAPGEFEGLGLGLAIAARAVARHGGHIRAEGAPGAGASFYVELPG